MRIFAFAASHRKESINRKLLKLGVEHARGQGAEIDLVDYGRFDLPIYDHEIFDGNLPQPARDFIGHVKAADGMIIASPEYNWSFPGSLKNIIDWASATSINPFTGKCALLLSASPSLRGGTVGLLQLRVPLEALGVFVFPRVFTLACANEAFDEKGEIDDIKLAGRLHEMIDRFIASTEALARL